MKLLGVKTLISQSKEKDMQNLADCGIVTNAAGALNQTYSAGDIVILNDVSRRDRQLMSANNASISIFLASQA